MNVFIEVNPLQQAERTGIANFMHFWLRAMLAQAPNDRFTLWSPETCTRDNSLLTILREHVRRAPGSEHRCACIRLCWCLIQADH